MANVQINHGGTWKQIIYKTTTTCSCSGQCTGGCNIYCGGTCKNSCGSNCRGCRSCSLNCGGDCKGSLDNYGQYGFGYTLCTGCSYNCYGECNDMNMMGTGGFHGEGSTTTTYSKEKINVGGTWRTANTTKLKVSSTWKSIP